eukprot:GFUD01018044.1.p1 GENE.GFUD01018044.1~~GFUD01018044.1.p1  ORF type:complete len:293 (+),score=45.82 GFUD01018044.1:219-1097(+)
MPWLSSCCCGFSVRTGTRAIAILSLVYSVLGLLMVGTFNIEKDKLLEKQHHNWPNSPSYQGGGNPILTTPDWNIGKETEGMTEEELKEFEKKKRLELIMAVYAVSVSVNFLVSLSLLAGVKLEKRWLLVPWISWNTLSLIVSQMAVFYAPNKTLSTIPDIFSTAISIYCILCVVSYFQTLSNPNRQSQTIWTSSECTPLPASLLPPVLPTQQALSPRPPLTVNLPPLTPDNPPAYQATDNPPVYDPPPPYPGSPEDKLMKAELADMLERSDEEGVQVNATPPIPKDLGKSIP